MTDTTTTESVVLTKDHRIKAFNWLYGLVGDEGHKRVSLLEEYVSGLEEGIEALQATTTQQAWDMRSLEATVENLRGEVGRLREALEFYAAHGGERARAALGEVDGEGA
jgi:hypothetical protein